MLVEPELRVGMREKILERDVGQSVKNLLTNSNKSRVWWGFSWEPLKGTDLIRFATSEKVISGAVWKPD